MTRKPLKKHKLTPARKSNGVLNPGSKPGKWNESMIRRAMFLASVGLTEQQISVALDIHKESIYYWKRTKPEFLEALLKGKLEYTERVEQALIESAVGYSHPDTHITVIDGQVIKTPITKHYPPNATAMMFYLSNRARDRWMDSRKVEVGVSHRHILDLTNRSDKELRILESIGILDTPENGSDAD